MFRSAIVRYSAPQGHRGGNTNASIHQKDTNTLKVAPRPLTLIKNFSKNNRRSFFIIVNHILDQAPRILILGVELFVACHLPPLFDHDPVLGIHSLEPFMDCVRPRYFLYFYNDAVSFSSFRFLPHTYTHSQAFTGTDSLITSFSTILQVLRYAPSLCHIFSTQDPCPLPNAD